MAKAERTVPSLENTVYASTTEAEAKAKRDARKYNKKHYSSEKAMADDGASVASTSTFSSKVGLLADKFRSSGSSRHSDSRKQKDDVLRAQVKMNF
jgi:hypothetical protein